MPDLDEFAAELVTEMMTDAARSIDRDRLKRVVGGHEYLADLTDAEYEAWLDQVLNMIETADITIDVQGG